MIKITKEGKKMLETTFGSKGQTKFKIQHIKPTCNACRDELRLVPGSSEPNDVISMESGYVFFFLQRSYAACGDYNNRCGGGYTSSDNSQIY